MGRDKRKNLILFLSIPFCLFFLLYLQKPASAQSDLFNRLVESSKDEVEKKGGSLSVGLEWTKRESKAVFKLFQKEFPFVKKFSVQRVRGVGQYQSMLLELKQGKTPDFDILKISMDVRAQFDEQGLSVKPPYDYQELATALPADWGELDPRVVDPRGYFLSTASYTHGIAYNKEAVPADKAPKSWQDCLDPNWKGKVLYDPRPKLHAFYYNSKFREWHVKWIKDLLKNEAVLNRGQTENLQKVAAGEFPLTCGIQYNSTARIMRQGAPVEFVLADPVSTRLATEFYVVKWSKTPATTQLLALWLATKGQQEIDKQGGRGFPWAKGTRLYPLAQGKTIAVCDADCSAKIAEEYGRAHGELLNLPGVR